MDQDLISRIFAQWWVFFLIGLCLFIFGLLVRRDETQDLEGCSAIIIPPWWFTGLLGMGLGIFVWLEGQGFIPPPWLLIGMLGILCASGLFARAIATIVRTIIRLFKK